MNDIETLSSLNSAVAELEQDINNTLQHIEWMGEVGSVYTEVIDDKWSKVSQLKQNLKALNEQRLVLASPELGREYLLLCSRKREMERAGLIWMFNTSIDDDLPF